MIAIVAHEYAFVGYCGGIVAIGFGTFIVAGISLFADTAVVVTSCYVVGGSHFIEADFPIRTIKSFNSAVMAEHRYRMTRSSSALFFIGTFITIVSFTFDVTDAANV